MDIKDKLTEQDKAQLQGISLECQVLNNLLKERQAILENKAQEVLAKAGLSPKMYGLRFNPSKDTWEAELKEGAIILPGQEVQSRAQRRRN